MYVCWPNMINILILYSQGVLIGILKLGGPDFFFKLGICKIPKNIIISPFFPLKKWGVRTPWTPYQRGPCMYCYCYQIVVSPEYIWFLIQAKQQCKSCNNIYVDCWYLQYVCIFSKDKNYDKFYFYILYCQHTSPADNNIQQRRLVTCQLQRPICMVNPAQPASIEIAKICANFVVLLENSYYETNINEKLRTCLYFILAQKSKIINICSKNMS